MSSSFIGCIFLMLVLQFLCSACGKSESSNKSYDCVDGQVTFGGDMMFKAPCGEARAEGFTVPSTTPRWINGKVPYVIDPSYGDPDGVLAAMRRWEGGTPIRFVERTNEADYVEIKPSTEPGLCRSFMGRVGGAQAMTLHPNGCVDHEIGHALGLMHEHQRPDRDQHIRILRENLSAEMASWYDTAEGYEPRGPYDVKSIMHYSSGPWNAPYLLTLDGQRIDPTEMSEQDFATIREMYSDVAPTQSDTAQTLASAMLAAMQAKVRGCTLSSSELVQFDANGFARFKVTAKSTTNASESVAVLELWRRFDAATNARIALAGVPRHYLGQCRR